VSPSRISSTPAPAYATVPQLHLLDTEANHPRIRGLHRAHGDLNAAVGYDRWDPGALAGTAADLRALAVRYDNAAPMLLDAAAQIDRAVADGDRGRAVVAHRIVDGLEHRVREELRRERRRLHLPPA
jgi:hypothetical protein